MSDTPRTDAIEAELETYPHPDTILGACRTLERAAERYRLVTMKQDAEIAQLRAEVERLREELQAYNRAFDAQPWTTDEPAMVLLGKITDRLAKAELTAEEACRNRDEARDEILGIDAENTELRAVASELRAEVERLKQQVKDDNKAYGCELRDPSGTIWEHAKRLEAEVERLKTDVDLITADRNDHVKWVQHFKARAERAEIALKQIAENEEKKSSADGWLIATARAAIDVAKGAK